MCVCPSIWLYIARERVIPRYTKIIRSTCASQRAESRFLAIRMLRRRRCPIRRSISKQRRAQSRDDANPGASTKSLVTKRVLVTLRKLGFFFYSTCVTVHASFSSRITTPRVRSYPHPPRALTARLKKKNVAYTILAHLLF